MILRILFLGTIGGLIGWLTNWLAIKMIFRPHKPYRIPVLNYTIQGLLPKRKGELAASVGSTVERELLPPQLLLQRVEELKLKQRIEETFAQILQDKLTEKLRMIPQMFRQSIVSYLHDLSVKELDKHLDTFLMQLQHSIVEESNLGAIVEKQINEFEMERLEELVFRIVATELKHIEILGGVLGFIIGLVQALIMTFVKI